MKLLKKCLPILAATIWISASEFLRNQVLFRSYWIEHYESLGLEFPARPVNGMVWGIWSLCLAVVIFYLLKKYSLKETVLFSWFVGFVMMWLVIGNMSVLPTDILIFAIPLSLLEVAVAARIQQSIK